MAMKRIRGIDFVRVICTIGIVAFHFYCHSASTEKVFLTFANGSLGSLLSNVFFIISGFVIHTKYGGKDSFSVKQYYYRRLRITLPPYIMAFLFLYLSNVMKHGTFFYMPTLNKFSLLFSFIGLDGYLMPIWANYYIVGEWFLGAVLIAYAVYPLLRKCFQKSRAAVMIVLTALFAAVLWAISSGIFHFPEGSLLRRCLDFPFYRRPANFLLCFAIGMCLAEHFRILKKPITVIISGAVVLIALFVTIPCSNYITYVIMGTALLVLLFNIGEIICKKDTVWKMTASLSALTYYVFIVHHQLIYGVLQGWNYSDPWAAGAVLLAVILLSFVFAKALSVLADSFYKSRLIRFADCHFMPEQRQKPSR